MNCNNGNIYLRISYSNETKSLYEYFFEFFTTLCLIKVRIRALLFMICTEINAIHFYCSKKYINNLISNFI